MELDNFVHAFPFRDVAPDERQSARVVGRKSSCASRVDGWRQTLLWDLAFNFAVCYGGQTVAAR